VGAKGAWHEGSGARRGLRHEGAVQEGKEGREKLEGLGSGGGRVRLYTCTRVRLADEVGSDDILGGGGRQALTGSRNFHHQSRR
jgi:hypothetical protein